MLLLGTAGPLTASAEITVRPFLIDVTLSPRESVTEQIRIDSTYEFRTATIFPTVNEITVGTEGEIREFVPPVMTDRSQTVTSWINISRAQIPLPANESVEIPLKISAHPQAEPGEYHVFIGMVEARNRTIANQIVSDGDAKGVIAKVTIRDERTEAMRLSAMSVDRFVTKPDSETVEVTITNPGEVASVPEGELVFYNARGIEVGSADVNTQKTALQPGAEYTFEVPMQIDGGLGRFKANLNMTYGAAQIANLYDTTTFFLIPVWYLVLFSAGLLVLISLLSVLIKRTMAVSATAEHGDEVALFVRDGHNLEAKDHDIDLSDNK